MAVFAYEALTQTGRLIQGILEGGSADEAREILAQMQLKVNLLEEKKSIVPAGRISKTEFLLFNQQLAAITKAGIPLERGLRELSNDLASAGMRRLIQQVVADLEAGLGLEQAVEKRKALFGPLYGRIIRAGIQTGRLPEMLTILHRHLEFAGQTRRMMLEALTYPAVVLLFGLLVLTGIYVFIIPQFNVILTETVGGRLPLATSIILAIPEYVLPLWTCVGLFTVALIAVLAISARSEGARRLREWLVMHLPVIGRVWYSEIMGRFSEAAATLVSTGCDMPTCLRLAADAAGSQRLRLEADILAGQVEQGRPILEAGQFCRMIPRLFLYSVQLGSQRHELQDNLHNLADMYTAQARYHRGRVSAALLPGLIVLLGALVAFTMMAIFVPMAQVLRALG
ncbi:MAG: type II secretion system F family protein [Sedimentisphaerales bacterium]|jgi:type II secretory pathway component PulF|nr:type II secretion system F family protein [Sedimentisphaerales bacterium]